MQTIDHPLIGANLTNVTSTNSIMVLNVTELQSNLVRRSLGAATATVIEFNSTLCHHHAFELGP